MAKNKNLPSDNHLTNVIFNMSAEGFNISAKTEKICRGIIDGKLSADEEVAKCIIKFQKPKKNG